MKVTYSDVKKYGVDEKKLKTLTIADRYLYRPAANMLVPTLFNVFKLTPNKISVLSMAVAVAAFVLISTGGNMLTAAIGSALIILFDTLDATDGSLARTLYYKYNIKNPLGAFYDAFAGYLIVCGLWVAFGFYLMNTNGNTVWFVLGVLSTLAQAYARLVHLKLRLVKLEGNLAEGEKKEKADNKLLRLYKEVDWGGFLSFLIFFAVCFGFLEYVLLAMMLVNFGILAWILLYVYKQTKIYPAK
ncbi:MAG: CDP-alcohol phosphatidyltransferase family protein [Helicobacteraceae bacterium]